MKKIAISGAGGFVGSFLTKWFTGKGFNVMPLHRELFQPGNQSRLEDAINGSQYVINLAGAPILHRWTDNYKKELLNSRVQTTRSLVNTMQSISGKPHLFISTSAVGYYPEEGCFDEYNAHQGSGFLSTVCEQWEEEALKASPEIRTVITRFGVILASEGGAFQKMALPARLKVSAIMGSGNQSFSWMSLTDLAGAMEFLMERTQLTGVFNFTVPEQITYRDFAKQLKERYHAFATMRIPSSFLRIGLGEAAGFIINTPCVLPTRLQEEGFTYQYPTLKEFLGSI